MPNVNKGTQVDSGRNPDDLGKTVHRLIQGKMNITFTFSPTALLTTTVVNHTSIGDGSCLVLFPLTPEAAAVQEKFSELRASRVQKVATISHPKFNDVTAIKFMGLVIGS